MDIRELRAEADSCDRKVDRMAQEIALLASRAARMRDMADAAAERLGRVRITTVDHPFERAIRR